MSFNLGVSNHPISRLGGLSSVGIYLYEDIYYRQWITEIALAFYEGRQDEFVWLDLVRQFRNPEKQQILPSNLTKEIIDEVSILYQEEPIYQVVDGRGKVLKEDQELWEEIMENSRYSMLMDKVDRWTRLLGTVLVKVSFIDPDTGQLVEGGKPGQVQLDLLHGGVYDVKHGASPYYITELLIGFGTKFGGFANEMGGGSFAPGSNVAGTIPSPSNYNISDARLKADKIPYTQAKSYSQLGNINRVYWRPDAHQMMDDNNQVFETRNPYGIIPAVPFFNADPAHYYFLPINEPLIYANHALNMRITDLNHIAKFQSFGVPVVRGVERPNSTRMGRPVDDFNQLKGNTAQSRFGGIGGVSGFGPAGQFRTFDTGFGIHIDGNADANELGMSLGPDTAVAVGEKGDFKFAHPNSDIMGLVKTIHSITDMVRINHGLRAKYDQQLPASGFAAWIEKQGVIEDNIRRSKLFKEREQQLFQTIKKLWNTHHSKSGQKRFNEEARLQITYKKPEFPVDPKTQKEDLMMEQKLIETGDKRAIKKLYPYMSESDINKLIKSNRKDRLDEAKHDVEVIAEQVEALKEKGYSEDQALQIVTNVSTKKQSPDVTRPKIDNGAKHAEESSKQPGKNTDQRRKEAKNTKNNKPSKKEQ